MYALIYLRNIDAQKRRELEQETAATKDALTGVFNRRLEEFRTELSKNGSYGITCSIGIATVKKEDFSYEKAFKEADEALYQSKRAGKNRYSYYEA